MDNENLKSQVASGMMWKFSERILAQGISFVVSLVLARILTPDEYGAVAMINVFIAIADILISSGFATALIQKKDATPTDYSTVFYVNFIIAVLLYVILFFTSPLIAGIYKLPELTWLLRVIALKLPISAYNSTQSAFVSRNMKFKNFFFSALGGTLASAVVGIVLAYNGAGAWALVAQQLTNLAIDTLIMSFTISWHPKIIFSKKSFTSMLGYSSRVMATDFTGQVFNQLNAFIVGIKYSSADLAYYTKGQQLPSMINTTITAAISSVLFPAVSKIHADKGDVKSVARRSMKMISFVLCPIMFGLAMVSNELVSVLYTDIWIEMVPYMQLMCLEGIIGVIGFVDILVLKAVGKSGMTLKLELIKKPLYLIIVLIAMQYGVLAIAISVPVVAAIGVVIDSFAMKKSIRYGFFAKVADCGYAFIASGVMSGIVFAVGLIPITSNGLMLVTKIAAGVAAYIFAAILTKNQSFTEIIQFLKKKLKHKKKNEKNSMDNKNENSEAKNNYMKSFFKHFILTRWIFKLYHKRETKKMISVMNRAVNKNGIETLSVLQNILSASDKKFFFDMGTLLGIIRERKLLKYDTDLDVALYLDDRSEAESIRKLILDFGGALKYSFCVDGIGDVEDSFLINGVKFDINYYTRDGDKDISYLLYCDETHTYGDKEMDVVRMECETITDIKKDHCFGFEINIPADSEKYLAQRYGEAWRIPDKNWVYWAGPSAHRIENVGRIKKSFERDV